MSDYRDEDIKRLIAEETRRYRDRVEARVEELLKGAPKTGMGSSVHDDGRGGSRRLSMPSRDGSSHPSLSEAQSLASATKKRPCRICDAPLEFYSLPGRHAGRWWVYETDTGIRHTVKGCRLRMRRSA